MIKKPTLDTHGQMSHDDNSLSYSGKAECYEVSGARGKPNNARRKASRALYAANILTLSRADGKNILNAYSSFPSVSPTKKVPTGFTGVPPSGPATPVIDNPHISLENVLSEEDDCAE